MPAVQICNGSLTANQGAGSSKYPPWGSGENNAQTITIPTQVLLKTGGTASRLYIRIPTNGVNAASSWQSYINGGVGVQDGGSIGSGVTGEFEDLLHSDPLLANDVVSSQLVVGAGGTNLTGCMFAVLFAALGGTQNILQLVNWAANGTSNTNYYGLAGTRSTTVESGAQLLKVKTAGTYRGFQANVSTNTRTTDSEYRMRVASADGMETLPVIAATTGRVSDLSNSDVVISGDFVDGRTTSGTGAGTGASAQSSVDFITTNTTRTTQYVSGAVAAVTWSASTTYFQPIQARIVTETVTESKAQVPARFTGTLSLYEAYVSANTVVGDGTITPRINAQNSATVAVTLTGLATGWFTDLTHIDAILFSDELNYTGAMGVGGTSLNCDYITCRPQITAGGRGLLPLGVGQRRDKKLPLAA